MGILSQEARSFISGYQNKKDEFTKAKDIARSLVESIVLDLDIELHLVTARVKDSNSLKEKLIRKSYVNPEEELVDLIGVRVITYYEEEVDLVTARLTEELEIDRAGSVDRRQLLGLRDFGYRSVHLIAKLKGTRMRSPEYAYLRDKCFEIQVRSILEHAWAEIEHEIVYKSGVQYPDQDLRLFAALAGTLEILNSRFSELRKRRHLLIEQNRKSYSEGKELDKQLDTARLVGLLSFKVPSAPQLPFGIATICILALQSVNIRSATELLNAMRGRVFGNEIKNYAATHSLEPSQVSQLARIIITVLLVDPLVAEELFSDRMSDPGIKAAVKRAHRREKRKVKKNESKE